MPTPERAGQLDDGGFAVPATARTVAGLCALCGVELPEAAIQFPIRHPAVASIVIGARDGAQVEQSLARASRPIPPQLWSDIDAVVTRN